MSSRQAPNLPAVERAISVLANTMRRYGEAFFQLGGLFDVDREEAINNLDRAFEAKLNAFHSLYDVSTMLFSYFEHGDTALLIAVRNALHHHNNPLFHSLLSRLYLEDGLERWAGATFLVAGYPARHDEVLIEAPHLIRLDDLDARLDPARASPHLDTFLRSSKAQERFDLIDRDLALAAIRQKATAERYPEGQVYLDLMPVFISGVGKVFRAMQAAGVVFRGDDAETYRHHFASGVAFDLLTPHFRVMNVGWPASTHCSGPD